MAFLQEIEIYTEKVANQYGHTHTRQRFRTIRTVSNSELKDTPENLCNRGIKVPGWATSVFSPYLLDIAQGNIPDGIYILKS